MGIKDRIFNFYFPDVLANRKIRRLSCFAGIVLMYHEVLPDEIKLPSWTVVRESDFIWQMRYLQENYNVVTIDHALDAIGGKFVNNKPFAVITFDDGYRGNLDTVLPIMETMGLPFVLYAATQAVFEQELYWFDKIINLLSIDEDFEICISRGGRDEYFKIPYYGGGALRWQRLQPILSRLKEMIPFEREIAVEKIFEKFSGISSPLTMLNMLDLQRLAKSDCITIGAHTHGHELLDQLEPQRIRETISAANHHISCITGAQPRHFSYPNGNYNQEVLDLVREVGYKTAVTTMCGTWSSRNSQLEIPRIGIGRFETLGRFKARVSGYL